jgi:hypothetical protein
MKSDKYTSRFKEAFALQKEQNALLAQKWNIKPIKLKEPIRHGYVRYLKIRPEYMKYPDYAKIKLAFDLVGHHRVYNKNIDFIVRGRKGTSHEIHSYMRHIVDPRFRYFRSDAAQAEECKKIDNIRKYLNFRDDIISCRCHANLFKIRQFTPHYEFKRDFMLEEVTDIHWLTHYTPVDPDIESRIAEIDAKLYRDHKYIWLKQSQNRYKSHDIVELKNAQHAYAHGYTPGCINNVDDIYVGI